MRLATIFTLVALPAIAQQGIRDSDQILTAAQMSDLLNDQVLEFFDGSKSHFTSDGAYHYTYTDDGPPWTGRFQVDDDSLVCVDFDNGSRHCDRFVRDGERVVLITEDGLRFPVRNRTVYQR